MDWFLIKKLVIKNIIIKINNGIIEIISKLINIIMKNNRKNIILKI